MSVSRESVGEGIELTGDDGPVYFCDRVACSGLGPGIIQLTLTTTVLIPDGTASGRQAQKIAGHMVVSLATAMQMHAALGQCLDAARLSVAKSPSEGLQ